MPHRDVECGRPRCDLKAKPTARAIAITARDVVIRIRDETVIDGLNLDVYEGEILGLAGASGSGKSVFLHALLGLLNPTGGEICVLGKNVTRGSDEDRIQLASVWGVVYQENALFSTLSVAENIAIVLRGHLAMPERLICEIVALKMSFAELPPETAKQLPAQLSVGMRKRAALARALALDPQLLLLDEPTAGFDPITAGALDELLLRLRRALGVTIFLITHDLDTLYRICDRIAVLVDKKIGAIGTTRELENSKIPWIAEYFGGARAKAAAAAAARAARPRPRDGSNTVCTKFRTE